MQEQKWRADAMTTTVVATARPVVRRRPSGEPPALRREARWTRWLAVLGGVLLAGAGLHLLARHTGVVDALERPVTTWFAGIRVPGLTNAARSLSALTALATVMAIRWIAVIVLFVQRRTRHAVVFVTTFVVTDWIVVRLLHVEASEFPSRAVSALAVTLFAVVAAFTPRGRATRHRHVVVSVLALVILSRLYLGSDHLIGSVYAVVLAAAVVTVMFRWLAPEESFPIVDRRGTVDAHLDLGGARRVAIVRAMATQLGAT